MLNPHVDRRTPGRLAWALVCAAIVACLLPLASFDVSAQAGPAAFSAVVYDPSGGVLPGVTVVLYDSAKNAAKTVTNGLGRFEFPLVAPGKYALEASLPGFNTLRHEFELRVPAQWTRAITLQIGTLEEQKPDQPDQPQQPDQPAAPEATSVGMTLVPNAGGEGLLIQEVQEDSAAAEKGFNVGDAILAVDNKPVATVDEFEAAIKAVKDSGLNTALIKADRNGAVRFIGLPLNASN